MRQLIALLFFSCHLTFGQMSIITTAAATSSGFFPSTVTTPATNTTGANLIIVACAVSNTNTSCAVTDSASNTWSLAATVGSGSGTGTIYQQTWYVVSPSTSATHTFTITANAGGNGGLPSLGVIAASGAATSGTVDVFNTSTTITVSVSPSTVCDLFVTSTSTGNSFAPLYPSGYTGVVSSAFSGSVATGIGVAYLNAAPTGVQTVTWTHGNTSMNVGFKAASTSGCSSGGGGSFAIIQ